MLSLSGTRQGLTADLSDQLEAIQKRALCIIFGGSSFTNQSYEHFAYTIYMDISPLSARRDDDDDDDYYYY